MGDLLGNIKFTFEKSKVIQVFLLGDAEKISDIKVGDTL